MKVDDIFMICLFLQTTVVVGMSGTGSNRRTDVRHSPLQLNTVMF